MCSDTSTEKTASSTDESSRHTRGTKMSIDYPGPGEIWEAYMDGCCGCVPPTREAGDHVRTAYALGVRFSCIKDEELLTKTKLVIIVNATLTPPSPPAR